MEDLKQRKRLPESYKEFYYFAGDSINQILALFASTDPPRGVRSMIADFLRDERIRNRATCATWNFDDRYVRPYRLYVGGFFGAIPG